jgi:hypothetical protein
VQLFPGYSNPLQFSTYVYAEYLQRHSHYHLTIKTKSMVNKALNFCTAFLMVGSLLAGIGCSKDNNNNNPAPKVDYTLSGTASGSQEVPAVTTAGSGSVTGSYNSSTNLLNYTVTWTGLSGPATLMHFHGPALAGANAGVALGITGFTSAASGSYTGSATLNDTQEADLLAGKWYYNVHTTNNGGGEIRAQVSAQ